MNLAPTSYGFLSSAPPTPCGLATFTSALAKEFERAGNIVSLVRVLDIEEAASPSNMPLIGRLIAEDRSTIVSATTALNCCDVVIVQHEYGLYGGPDGEDVLRVLQGLNVPSMAILHTVLASPTQHQRAVLNEVIKSVDAVVVMTESAERTLREVFIVGSTPVRRIPHGAAVVTIPRDRAVSLQPTVLTWGLLGPGKGIEWAIEAMAQLRDLTPTPHYVIAGRTHPKVLAREGEHYRQKLIQKVDDLGITHMVSFDNSYRDSLSLAALIDSADVVVLPYDSKDQATSGVLVDAIAAGLPVIATSFPHAAELLSSGAGVIVDRQDPFAIATALREIMTVPDVAERMAREARRVAAGLSWESVAGQYLAMNDFLLKRLDVPA
jgi:glycosyltransferase involved in cell wall biosynthesis